MAEEPIKIKRYPNRRFYATHISSYISLAEIEDLIREGRTVEIRDSQTGEDLTRTILTQIIVDRHPDKVSLFPSAMLHFILRANNITSDFLRDYLRNSVTYLEFLQQHGSGSTPLPQPMHWMKAWMDGLATQRASRSNGSTTASDNEDKLARRIEELEQRIHQLEATAGDAD